MAVLFYWRNEEIIMVLDFGKGKSKSDAKRKLTEMLEEVKEDENKKSIIDYLLGRIAEDSSLAEDITEEHKNWTDCWKYIENKARKQAVNGCAMIKEEVVYEWAEDYFHEEYKEPPKAEIKPKTTPKSKAKPKVEEKAKDDNEGAEIVDFGKANKETSSGQLCMF